MFRVAMIGAGGIAKQHARGYAALPNAELIGIADVQQEAATTLAGAYGATPYTDVQRMLEELRPDVVDLCVPTPYHVDCLRVALECMPQCVIVEKPMARTVADCHRMLDAAAAAGIPLFVAHVLRFFPEFVAAKAQIDAGAVGRVAAVRVRRGGPFPRGSRDWYGDLNASGGVAIDLMVHDLDWLRWTFGEAERVFAKGVVGRPIVDRLPGMDYALATVRFQSGMIAHLEATWADPSGFRVQFEVAGDEGLLEYNFNQPAAKPLTMALQQADMATAAVPVPESPLAMSPYTAELAHFLDCVENGTKPRVTPRDGLEAVRLGNAVLDSIITGKPVSIKVD